MVYEVIEHTQCRTSTSALLYGLIYFEMNIFAFLSFILPNVNVQKVRTLLHWTIQYFPRLLCGIRTLFISSTTFRHILKLKT
jgi:hypothetical protein